MIASEEKRVENSPFFGKWAMILFIMSLIADVGTPAECPDLRSDATF